MLALICPNDDAIEASKMIITIRINLKTCESVIVNCICAGVEFSRGDCVGAKFSRDDGAGAKFSRDDGVRGAMSGGVCVYGNFGSGKYCGVDEPLPTKTPLLTFV